MKSDQIAVQLYTFRHVLKERGLVSVLESVAKHGYSNVEFAGLGSERAADVAECLRQLNISAQGAHVPSERWEASVAQVLDEVCGLGSSWAIVPKLPDSFSDSLDSARAYAHRLNEWGAACKEYAVGLAYHNHGFEFTRLDGTSVWEALLQELEPELVSFEVDVYWAARAGRSPVELLNSLGSRARLIHMKDMVAGPVPRDGPVGSGILPWQDIVEAGDRNGAQWFVVEQEEPVNDIFMDAQASRDFLVTLAR
jgi:sugar phosphate isomerase/epimerase